MAGPVIPCLFTNEYKSFLDLPTKGLPATFAEWEQLGGEQGQKLIDDGIVPEHIEVYFDEFSAFIRDLRAAATVGHLYEFARKKLARQKEKGGQVGKFG